MDKHLIDDIKHISLSLFNKNFFSVYHGSISARISSSGFIINSKDTILDEVTEDSLVRLDCQKRDYRWSMANQDVHIHEHIYVVIRNRLININIVITFGNSRLSITNVH